MIRLLTGLNDALYEIVVYIVILPKTLFKVIIAPKWISPYVEAELQKDPSERFNEFAAPMIFFLGFCVMPLLAALRFTSKFQELQSLDMETKVFAIFIFLVSWPLAASLVLQFLKRAPLSRTALRSTFYPQAYCIGAAYLVGYLALPMMANRGGEHRDWMFGMFLASGLYFYWFVYSEVCIIRQQLAVGTVKALGTLVLIYFVGLAIMTACQTMILISVGKAPAFLSKPPSQTIQATPTPQPQDP